MATAGSLCSLLVRDVMTAAPETLHATHSVRAAIRIFAAKPFEHLPVVSAQRLIGVISNRDVHAFVAKRPGALDIELAAMMTKNPIVVLPDMPLVDAARLLIDRRIHCLPVVDEARVLLGILTPTDVLRAIIDVCLVPLEEPASQREPAPQSGQIE